MPDYCYVFTRKDIPLADQVVQTAHSALEAGRKFQYYSGTHLILCEVKNEHKLFEVADDLDRRQTGYVLFYEPDDNMGFTSLATQSILDTDREPFARYKIWR